jgi:hypothetical protein
MAIALMKPFRRTIVAAFICGSALLGADAPLGAQTDTSKIAVTGIVGDAQAGTPLAGALVTIPDLGIRTLTDSAGRFVLLDVPRGDHNWLFRMIGYADWQEEMAVEHMEHLRIGLLARPIALKNITVTVDRLRTRRNRIATTVHAISDRDILSAAGTNAADVVRSRIPYPVIACHDDDVAPGLCIRVRGSVVRARVVLDEIPASYDVLYTFALHDIAMIEFYGGQQPQVRVYTRDFMARGLPLVPVALMGRN